MSPPMNGPTTPVVTPSPPMTTTATLAGLSELLAKATKGPWSIAADDLTECFVINGANQIVPVWEENDLTLIVAAVNALPTLLARIAALEGNMQGIEIFASRGHPLRDGFQHGPRTRKDLGEDMLSIATLARDALTLKENDCGN